MRRSRRWLAALVVCFGATSLGAQPRHRAPRPPGGVGRAPQLPTAPQRPTILPPSPSVSPPIARIRRLLRLAMAEAEAGSCESARLAREACATLLGYAEDACRISAGEVSLGGGGAQEGALFSGPEPTPPPPALGTAVRFCTGVLRAAGVTPPTVEACGSLTGGEGDGFAIAQVATGPITVASAEAHYRDGLRQCESPASESPTPPPIPAPGPPGANPPHESGPAPRAGTARRLSLGLDLGAVVPVVPDLYDRLYGAACVLDLGVRVSVARWRWEVHAMGLGAPAQGTTFNGAEQQQDVYGFGVRGAALVALLSRPLWEVQLGPEVGYLFLQREFARRDLPVAVPERQHGHHLLVGAVVGVERQLWPPTPSTGRNLSVTLNVAADYVLLSVNEEPTHSAQVRVTGGVRYAL